MMMMMIMELFVIFSVVCPIVVRFTARLDVNEDETVMGETILRQEICVLCRGRLPLLHAIRAFQNRNPFRLSAKICIGKFVKYPEDIGSSDDENCFFVVDSEERCVWKIGRQSGKHHRFLCLQPNHFPLPATLSVSCDGQQILMLTRNSVVIYSWFRP